MQSPLFLASQVLVRLGGDPVTSLPALLCPFLLTLQVSWAPLCAPVAPSPFRPPPSQPTTFPGPLSWGALLGPPLSCQLVPPRSRPPQEDRSLQKCLLRQACSPHGQSRQRRLLLLRLLLVHELQQPGEQQGQLWRRMWRRA